VLVRDACILKLILVFAYESCKGRMYPMASYNENIRLVNFLEDVLEPAIIFLQDGVLGGQELTTPIIKADVKKTERVNVPAAFF
jgi:hypothetical protein